MGWRRDYIFYEVLVIQKNYFFKKLNSILKIRNKLDKLKGKYNKKLVFFSNFNTFVNRSVKYKNIAFSPLIRRKTIIYIQPFFVNRIFFSKMFGNRLIKRLANTW
jgi:hypothetical protein